MKTTFNHPRGARRDRLIRERVHDPYQSGRKLSEPTVCPKCKAVFRRGRWQWADSWPYDAHEETCEACHRIQDHYPAAELTLTGQGVAARRAEILSLARHTEEKARALHPLERIMAIMERPDRMVITTTDLHLPRRLGEALQHAYKGDLHKHYDAGGCFLRVNWNCET